MKNYCNFIKENIMTNPSDGIGNIISKYIHMNDLTIHFDFGVTSSDANVTDELFYFYKDDIIYSWDKQSEKIWLCEDIIREISKEIDESLHSTTEFVDDFFIEYYVNCNRVLTYGESYKDKLIQLFDLFDDNYRQYNESRKIKKIELSENDYAKIFLDTIYYDTLKIAFNLLDYPSSLFFTSDKFFEDDYYEYSWICEISHNEIYKEFVLNSPIFDILNRQYIDSDYSLRDFLSKYTKFGDLPVVWSTKEVYL